MLCFFEGVRLRLRKCGRTFCAKMRNLAVCLHCKRIKSQNGVVVRQKKNMRLKRLKITKIKYYTKNRKKLCIFNFFVYLCAKLINQLVMAKEKQTTIEDLEFDDKNFNRHTEFGLSLVEKSLRKNGAGRSILIDKNNRIIGGNGVVEVAGQIGMNKVRIVESDGSEIIAVKRTDIDLDSKQGREMALADNATAAVDLEWDADAIADVSAEFDIDVSGWGVFADDLDLDDDIFNNLREGGFSTGLTEDAGVFQKSFVFPVKYRDNIDGFIKKNGTKDITKKIIELCLNAEVK